MPTGDKMTVKEDLFMKRIELDLIKLKGGIFENTPRKDFFIKHTRGYVESILEQRDKDDYIQDPETGLMQGRQPSGNSNNSGLTDSSESSKIKTKEQAYLANEIKNNRISLDINPEMQNRHLRGTKEYEENLARRFEKSYFNVDEKDYPKFTAELQSFLKSNATSGAVYTDSRGNVTEVLKYKKNSGYDTRLKQSTSYIKAFYSKSRTHVSPHTPKPKNKKR